MHILQLLADGTLQQLHQIANYILTITEAKRPAGRAIEVGKPMVEIRI